MTVAPNDVVTEKRPVQPLPSTAEQLAAVQSALGLNNSQLADVCAVKRQTIYDWYAGNFAAEGANAARLAQLYRVVTTLRNAGLRSVPLRTVDKPLADGGTLLSLLCAEELNAAAIRGAVAQIQSTSGAPKESARAQRERLGLAPLSEEQRQANLDSILDYFADG